MRTAIVALLILIAILIPAAAFADFSGEENGHSSAEVDDPNEQNDTVDSFFYLYQPYLDNITSYEPIYILIGTKPSKSKFQISFKYRLLNPNGWLAQEHPWVEGFHFGYTQTSYWNLESDSMPFDDTSYKPELFHVTRNFDTRPSWADGLFFKTGIRHESNGRDKDLSRSVNNIYWQPIFIVYKKQSKLGMSISPKLWFYFNLGEHTSHIEDYRGYIELDLKFGKADSLVLDTDLRWGKEGGSILVDLTYPIRPLLENLNIYLHVQCVSALGESLLHYDERTEAVRIGFSFVR